MPRSHLDIGKDIYYNMPDITNREKIMGKFDGILICTDLDDPFSELDGAKLGKAKELIKELGNDRQVIYLTCHESRKIQ